MTADEIIATLGLTPHSEGGHFRETFRDTRLVNGRAASTVIYFLLRAGEESRWHRLDATEVWHWYAGAPLALNIAETERKEIVTHTLGPRLAHGETPHIVVPVHAWQSARSLGDYTLVGCTMAPGFEYSGFELAPTGFKPGEVQR